MNYSENIDSYYSDKEEGFSLKEIFISFLILFFVLLTWYVVNDYESTYETAKDDALTTSKIASLQVHSTFEKIRNVLIVISSELSDKNLLHLTNNGLQKYLNSRSMLISDTDALVLVDENGKVISSNVDGKLNSDLSSKKYFNDVRINNYDQLIYSEQEKSIFSNEPVISFNHRTTDQFNNFNGMISALVPLEIWYQNFQQQKLSKNQEISIINLNNCTIIGTSTKTEQAFNSKYIYSSFCKDYFKSNTKAEASSIQLNNSSDIVSFVTIPEFKIAVVTFSSHKDFLLPFYKKVILILISSIIIIFGYWKLIKHQLEIEEGLKEKKLQMINSSKMATLGEMASGIAHEINNPLAIIRGRLQQAIRLINKKEDVAENLISLEKSISTALMATDRIGNIVSGMKSISRENNTDAMSLISLDKILNNTMIFCQEKFKNAEVGLEIGQIPTVDILCRESQVSQVILNLLNNSFDAIETLPNRWVKIEFDKIENKQQINLIFTDSGNGIPADILKKMMQPFFTTKPVGKGTGLGLSISVRIMKEHGGLLEYNNQSPNTQFIITLPYQEKENLS